MSGRGRFTAVAWPVIVPVIIVALIYKVGHLEDWSKFDVFNVGVTVVDQF